MKKVNEINLTVGIGRSAAPHVRGKQPYYSGYSGGMTDSASSSYSSWSGSKKFDIDLEEEEEDLGLDTYYEEKSEKAKEEIMRETSFKRIKKATGGYSLIETLKVLNENLDSKSLKILDDMEEVHEGLITDLIDSIQSIAEIIPTPVPGLDQGIAGIEYVGGAIAQFTAGNAISKMAKVFANTRADKGSITAVISELSTVLLALPAYFSMPIVAIVNKVAFDAIECIGNLGTILDKSPTKKDSMYNYTVTDVAKELLGDAIPSAIEAIDPTDIVDGLVGSIRLAKNLIELWSGTGKGEELIEQYNSLSHDETDHDQLVPNKTVTPIASNSNNAELETLINNAVKAHLSEVSHYGIDEDLEEELEEELDEFSSAGAVAGYTTPLKAPTKDQLEKLKTFKEAKQRKKAEKYAEEVRKLQIWKLKTSGRTVIK